jgi:hypothetical protein
MLRPTFRCFNVQQPPQNIPSSTTTGTPIGQTVEGAAAAAAKKPPTFKRFVQSNWTVSQFGLVFVSTTLSMILMSMMYFQWTDPVGYHQTLTNHRVQAHEMFFQNQERDLFQERLEAERKRTNPQEPAEKSEPAKRPSASTGFILPLLASVVNKARDFDPATLFAPKTEQEVAAAKEKMDKIRHDIVVRESRKRQGVESLIDAMEQQRENVLRAEAETVEPKKE